MEQRPKGADGRTLGVVVACPRADGRWLLIRRSATVIAPRRICFPGGHIEAGESDGEAAVREMREELGVAIEPVRRVWEYALPERPVTLYGWLGRLHSLELRPAPAEVEEVLWLTLDQAASHPEGLPATPDFAAALAPRGFP